MRLLRREGGALDFEIANEREFTTPYAILSHTWGEEEVTYQDVLAGRSNRKVLFTLDQAEKDGYSRVWIDTCCIDRTNAVELGEAINLMWKYYTNADICYAYLHGPIENGNRWFKRGWTLQELIAPREVVFFCDEVWRGTRQGLVDVLSRESKIDRGVLSGHKALGDVPLVQRYDWAAGRDTKKVEDMVYCLLGLFEVTMVLNYGIGLQQARHDFIERVDRKHGILVGDQLRVSMRAGRTSATTTKELMNALRFDNMASRRENIKMPVRETCDWLLQHADFKRWLHHSCSGGDSMGFLWIKGHPGAGKSTLMKFADERSKDGHTQISFYFNARGGPLEKSVEGAYRSLLVQLLRSSADLQTRVCGYLQETHRRIESLWTIEVLQALLRLIMDIDDQVRVRCFIDALDECDLKEIRAMTQFFHELSQDARRPFSVCFASRYYPALILRHCVELRLDQQREHTHAIEHYIQRTLLVEDNAYGISMKEKIIAKAKGVFIWAVLVVQQLNAELERGNIYLLSGLVDALPLEIDEIYHALVIKNEEMEQFKLCIQLIFFSSEPLTSFELYFAVLFGLGKIPANISESNFTVPSSTDLKRFTSSITRGLAELVPGKPETAQFVHESVPDFLRTRGLQSIFTPTGVSISALSHNAVKQLLCRYLDESEFSADRDGVQQSTLRTLALLSSWDADDYSFDNGLPLAKLIHRDLIYHAERCSDEIDQDDFLHALDWHSLSAIHQAIEEDDPVHAYGLLAWYNAPTLASRVFELTDSFRRKALGPTPVVEAALMSNDPIYIERLMQHGHHVDEPDLDGFTPLAVLTSSGMHTKTAVYLVEHGARADAMTMSGYQILAEACRWRWHDVIQAITCSGADLDMRDDKGRTALMVACETDDAKATALLLKRGAALETVDNMGRTALFYCRGRVSHHILLGSHVDIHVRDSNGDTAMSSLVSWFLKPDKAYRASDRVKVDVILTLLACGQGSLPEASRLIWLRQKATASRSSYAPLMAALLEYVARGYHFEPIDAKRGTSLRSYLDNPLSHFDELSMFIAYGRHMHRKGQWKTELPPITTYSRLVRMIAGKVVRVADEGIQDDHRSAEENEIAGRGP